MGTFGEWMPAGWSEDGCVHVYSKKKKIYNDRRELQGKDR
jgi:hypothetical protein